MANTAIGRNHNRPDRSHDDNKQHRIFSLAKPEQGQGNPADAWQGLQSQRHHTNRVFANFEACRQEAKWDTDCETDRVAIEEAAQRHERGLQQASVRDRQAEVANDAFRRR